MSFLKSPEFKVGVLVIGIGALVAFMSMQVSNDPSYLSRSKKAWFALESNPILKPLDFSFFITSIKLSLIFKFLSI